MCFLEEKIGCFYEGSYLIRMWILWSCVLDEEKPFVIIIGGKELVAL